MLTKAGNTFKIVFVFLTQMHLYTVAMVRKITKMMFH